VEHLTEVEKLMEVDHLREVDHLMEMDHLTEVDHLAEMDHLTEVDHLAEMDHLAEVDHLMEVDHPELQSRRIERWARRMKSHERNPLFTTHWPLWQTAPTAASQHPSAERMVQSEYIKRVET
jgi:hypothetical protein